MRRLAVRMREVSALRELIATFHVGKYNKISLIYKYSVCFRLIIDFRLFNLWKIRFSQVSMETWENNTSFLLLVKFTVNGLLRDLKVNREVWCCGRNTYISCSYFGVFIWSTQRYITFSDKSLCMCDEITDICIANKMKYLKNKARKRKSSKDVILSF